MSEFGQLNTIRLSATARGLRAAAAMLRGGGLVAFPTETVYGLGADARNERAVAEIYRAKARPAHNPLIVHFASAEEALSKIEASALAEKAAHAFWPGPLTIVAPVKSARSDAFEMCRAGSSGLAVRVPAAQIARDLLREGGMPLAAPSANPSGGVSPTTADHVMEGLYGRVDGVIDGGPCAVGLESTILELSASGPRLLRPGGVTLEALEAALGPISAEHLMNDTAPNAPGQLSSHYAPNARLRLDADAPRAGEAWLGFGPDPQLEGPVVSRSLSAQGRLDEAAATLFSALRAIDTELEGGGVIAVAPIPHEGLGRAINDRLARAAAPRR